MSEGFQIWPNQTDQPKLRLATSAVNCNQASFIEASGGQYILSSLSGELPTASVIEVSKPIILYRAANPIK